MKIARFLFAAALASLAMPAFAQNTVPYISGTGGLTPGHCIQSGSTVGQLVDSGAGCGGGGSSAFSALTSSTNTTAAMVVGTGASLSASGSGTIDATTLLTKTWAAPAAIGTGTPAGGAFTTLSASSTVSGSGFSTYLASPPAIGGTAPAAGHFTTLSATGLLTTVASATGGAGINVPPGTAPTSPVNGDFWSTSSGFFGRVAGTTVGPFGAGGGSVSITAADGTIVLSPSTITGTGTIAVGTVPLANIATIANQSVLGNGSGSSAVPAALTLGANLVAGASTLNVTSPVEATTTSSVTLASTDMGKTVVMNVSGGGTLTISATGFGTSVLVPGQTVYVQNVNASATTVTNSTTGPVPMVPSITSIPSGATLALQCDSTCASILAQVNPASFSVTATAITVGTTTVGSGTSGDLLYNNSGVLGNETLASLLTSPPAIGGTSPAAVAATTLSATGLLTTAASATGGAGINVPPGTAPTSPNNGDFWSTSSGFFGRVAGTTVGPFGTGGTGCAVSGGAGLLFNNGSSACVTDTDVTFSTHTITFGSSGILDLSAVSVTAGLKLPSAAGAVPTADGVIAVNTTTHALVSGSNGTTIVQAAAATGTGTATTCTNQVITAVSAVAIPTCTTVTGAMIQSSAALAGSPTTTTQSANDNSTKVATTAYVDRPTALPTPGTSGTLAAPRSYYVCTTTCTVTLPVPAAGDEFCVMNDDNISTVITLAAIGSSARYENTARTAYGTAGTGTFVSGGAVGDMVCVIGRDSTHYLTVSFLGTWTAS